jgi:hypothetical protein
MYTQWNLPGAVAHAARQNTGSAQSRIRRDQPLEPSTGASCHLIEVNAAANRARMRLEQTNGQRSTRTIARRAGRRPPFAAGPQRRLACFSRLAARFSSAVLVGFFLASFLRSMPLLMVSPSARRRAAGCHGASAASPAARASSRLHAASSGADNSADARCLQTIRNPHGASVPDAGLCCPGCLDSGRAMGS